MIDVLIGGDVCPVGRNEELFRKGDAEAIFNDLLVEFKQADLSIVNLECPFIEKPLPIIKSGPVLDVDDECIRGLKAASIKVLNLANNHILDHGARGLLNTMHVCDEIGITTFGAGKDLQEARRIVVFDIKGCRIGLSGLAEHEFSSATQDKCGASPLDIMDFIRNVKERKNDFDYLIVFLHGGNEGYPYPSPRLMNICRFMAETGANAVICQHTHCPGCYENYNGSHIVYGQGNLIFDFGDRGKAWNEGFLVELQIGEDFSSSMRLIPYRQAGDRAGAGRMGPDDENLLLSEIDERSKAILKPGFVEETWLKYCHKNRFSFQNALMMPFRIQRFLNRRGWLINLLYSRKYMLRFLNLIRCEAHRDAIITCLENEQWKRFG